MSTPHCKKCSAVMVVAKRTDRWTIYKCSACRSFGLKGVLSEHLSGREREDAEREMDSYADALLTAEHPRIIEELSNMPSDELQAWMAAQMQRQERKK